MNSPAELELPLTKRGQQRRDALLENATTLFLEQGYEAVSLDDIVQLAGGSKATIYKYFGNKEGLFTAICDYRRERLFNDICRPFELQTDAIKPYLQQTLLRFYHHIVQPENVAFLRVFLEQSQRNPVLAQSLFNKCTTRMQNDISRALHICHDAGILYCTQPQHSATMFFGLLGDVEWKIIMGVPVNSDDPEQLIYIDYCIDLFLKAHQHS